MKKTAFILLLLAICLESRAQYSREWTSGSRLDDGLYAFRMSVMPDYSFYADDYVQYAPGAALLLLKACGVESRSGWGGMLTAAAAATAIDAALINGLKYSVCRMRPDNSAKNSFPSGHTGTAFMTATLLQKEFGWKYPWVGFSGYAVATAVGLSRMANNRHWGTDVLGGALIGIAAGELGYWISSLIFKENDRTDYFVSVSNLPYELGVYFSTAVGLRSSKGTGSALSVAGIGASIPFTKHLGATLRLGICGEKQAGGDDTPYLSSYEALAGIYAGWDLFGLAFIRPHALLGTGFGKAFAGRAGFQYAAGMDLGLQITENYAFKFTADYESCPGNWSGVMLGGGASFCF